MTLSIPLVSGAQLTYDLSATADAKGVTLLADGRTVIALTLAELRGLVEMVEQCQTSGPEPLVIHLPA